ncbi:hypothetical protein GQ44DRAFT_705599 [Phaeosphaeriaceae sp. PMI808]|nr:hypothetical protein GQ44DRAFT_705599 [Phaeosphaeriaceae sp. PMI808]
MVEIRTELEISATPEEVRAIVLDFAQYSYWHTSFIQSIATIPPAALDTHTLHKGAKLDTKIGGIRLKPTVKSNNLIEFSWYGSALGGAFAGTHYFQYFESHITPGGTTFVHGEDYSGWMCWLFGESVLGLGRRKVIAMYQNFSKDVKTRAEQLRSTGEEATGTQVGAQSKP